MIQSSSSKGFKLIIQKNDYATMVVLLVFVTAVLVGATSLFTKALVVMALCLGISSSVHSAELVAKKIGASWGTLILALAVTIVEVALILGLMKLKTPGAATIARDTVFSSLMILTNGEIGRAHV